MYIYVMYVMDGMDGILIESGTVSCYACRGMMLKQIRKHETVCTW